MQWGHGNGPGRLFPAADRLPVVPSELRSKGTRREALPGLISGTFLLAPSGERRALWSAVALTTSRPYLAIDILPAVLAKYSPPRCLTAFVALQPTVPKQSTIGFWTLLDCLVGRE